jgi:hypothetical protein
VVIDPLGQRADVTQLLPLVSVRPTAAPILGVLGPALERIAAELETGRHLSPTEKAQIVELVRATVEVFATASPTGGSAGTRATLQIAVVALGALQQQLTASLASHQDRVAKLEPMLGALLVSADVDEPAATVAYAAAPVKRTDPAEAESTGSLARSLAAAVTRLDGTLKLAERLDHPGVERWLLDAAVTHAARLDQTKGAQSDAARLTRLVRLVLDDCIVNTSTNATSNGPEVAQSAVQSGQGVLDRHPGLVRLLTGIVYELGLVAASEAQAGGLGVESSAAFARALMLVSALLAEAEKGDGPALNTQLWADLRAAGMPQFSLPADSPNNLDTFRWLLVAAQLYGRVPYRRRVTPRSPPPRCYRCARIMRRTRLGAPMCPKCA